MFLRFFLWATLFFIIITNVRSDTTKVFSLNFSEGEKKQTSVQDCHVFDRNTELINLTDGKKALRFGKKTDGSLTGIVYRLKNKNNANKLSPFPLRSGRIEFSFRPVDWKIGDPPFNMLVSLNGEQNNVLHLVYIRASDTGLPSIQAAYGRRNNSNIEKGKIPVLYSTIPIKEQKEWYHVVFEWNPLTLKMIVNGDEKIFSTKDLTIPDDNFTATELQIGSYAPALLRGLTDIVDLEITTASPEEQQSNLKNLPYFQIPYLNSPIIDGKLNLNEYNNAVQLTGFTELPFGRISAHQSMVWSGYDDKNLYFAIKSDGHNRPPKCTFSERDANLWEDDSFDLFLDPTPETPDYYHFIFNFNNAVFDQHSIPENSQSLCRSFNAENINVASSFNDESRIMEIAIPLNNFKIQNNTPTWLFNLGENNPGNGIYSLANTKHAYAERKHWGSFIFLNKDKKAFKFEQLGELFKGKPQIITSAQKIEITGRRYDETAMTEFPLFSEIITADSSGKTKFNGTSDWLGKNGTLYLTAFENDNIIFAGSYPYEIISNIEIENIRRLSVSKSNRLKVSTLHTAGKENKLLFLLKNKNGDLIKKFPPIEIKGFRQDSFLELNNLTPDEYSLHLQLIDKENNILKSATPRQITVYSEAKPWKDNKLGVSSLVPFPWTPLELTEKAEEITVKCWNRKYIFQKNDIFPGYIFSGENNYLENAPQLNIFIKGKKYTVKGDSLKLISQNSKKIIINMQGAIPDIAQINVNATIEYDGFMWFDVDVTPLKAINVDAMNINFSMPLQQSSLLNSGYRDLTDTGLRPKTQWCKKLDDVFGPFWLGNETGGISFAIESAENWHNKDKGKQIILNPLNNRSEIIMNFIDTPFTIDKKTDYGFCLHPTPVRPRPVPHRTLRSNMYFGHQRGNLQNKPYNENLSWWTSTFLYQGYPYWMTDKSGIKIWEKNVGVTARPWNNFDNLPAKTYRTAWYAAYSSIARNAPEVIWYGDEWRSGNQDKLYGDTSYGYEMDMIEVCKTKDYTDFYLWKFDESRKNDPKIDGIYFDLMMFPACTRADHNHGYRSENGKRLPTWTIREHRKFLERIYTYCKLEADNAPVVMHMSGATARISGFSFSDYFVDGELWSNILVKERSYKPLKLDQFRAEALPHIYGQSFIWISQLYRILPFVPANLKKTWKLEPWAERHMAGILLLHDIIPDRTSQNDTAYDIWKAIDRFNLKEDAKYIGYFDHPNRIAGNADGINTAISAYRQNDDVMLILFNNHDCSFTFNINSNIFGKKINSCEDLEKQSKILPDKAGIFQIDVPMRNLKIVKIQLKN